MNGVSETCWWSEGAAGETEEMKRMMEVIEEKEKSEIMDDGRDGGVEVTKMEGGGDGEGDIAGGESNGGSLAEEWSGWRSGND